MSDDAPRRRRGAGADPGDGRPAVLRRGHPRGRHPAHRRGGRGHPGDALPALPVQGRPDLGLPRAPRGSTTTTRSTAIIAAHPDDPRGALTELATALTRDDFAAVRRGCPFINASAEFTGSHPARVHAREIRRWVTDRIEELLRRARPPRPPGDGRAADDGAHRRRRLGRPGRQRAAQRGLPGLLGAASSTPGCRRQGRTAEGGSGVAVALRRVPGLAGAGPPVHGAVSAEPVPSRSSLATGSPGATEGATAAGVAGVLGRACGR